MNVLCTGGAGFIGANLLHLLVPRHPEHRFVVVDKLTYAATPASLDPVRGAIVLVEADIADEGAMERVFAEHAPELVLHLAAESHVDRSIASPKEFLHTNVEGTFVLLEAARRHWRGRTGVRFHHVGTDEVYGSLGDEGRFDEESPYDPSSPYSASKAASDHLVRAWGRTYGLPFTITHCSNNYGPDQVPEKLVPRMILAALAREPLPVYGQGQNVRDWLYVADHCEAIWAVATRGRQGETYGVGGGTELRNLDVVERICRVIADMTRAPLAELLDLVRFVDDRPGHDLRYSTDASKITDELGWRPRESFETGLRKTVRWYLDHEAWVKDARARWEAA
ncbi:MAG: dTDP-glucose 4,6-dehydratase [Sandaracinaceae bacterium]|nr:dTDP-glucose 4,6-dehydratase [Sandaracinaceae bacterium]